MRTLILMFFCCGILPNALAQINANQSINDLSAKSDVVAVGQTLSVNKVGRSEEAGIEADVEKVKVKLLEVLKGEVHEPEIEFTFLLPDRPMGYHGVPANSFRIVFLHGTVDNFQVASPYRPSLPACPTFHSSQGEIPDRIRQHILATLSCDQLPEQQRLEAMDIIRGQPGEAATTALQGALAREPVDSVLSLSIVAELLRRNDVTVLPRARAALQSDERAFPRSVHRNIAFAIGELHSAKAIPELSSLMAAPDVVVRRSAAGALRNTGTTLAVDPLAHGLRDTDFQVRYLAVIGLAEITGQSNWRPLVAEFKGNETRYLTHWKKWVSSSRVLATPTTKEQ